ncbi:hypothetical protein HAX54_016780 [Datura stramonium]|uniref:Uncharacterized protein n=1 Tax=Datura stramonium TaxID=4076 RepID=A0ABS8UJK8_DATST|nr:hypothetical protein [Datura stramonium]
MVGREVRKQHGEKEFSRRLPPLQTGKAKLLSSGKIIGDTGKWKEDIGLGSIDTEIGNQKEMEEQISISSSTINVTSRGSKVELEHSNKQSREASTKDLVNRVFGKEERSIGEEAENLQLISQSEQVKETEEQMQEERGGEVTNREIVLYVVVVQSEEKILDIYKEESPNKALHNILTHSNIEETRMDREKVNLIDTTVQYDELEAHLYIKDEVSAV